MRRRRWLVILTLAALLAAGITVGLVALRRQVGQVANGAPGTMRAPDAELGPPMGRAFGAAARAFLAGIPEKRVAVRCMRAEARGLPDLVLAGKRTFRREGRKLLGGDADRRVRIGIIADARGATTETLANAGWARRSLGDVDLYVILGGMGRTREEIATVLGALADDKTLLVAIPGDREPVPAFEEAIATLTAAGKLVVDGARVPIVVVDGVAIGLVPGAAVGADGRAHDLVAGPDGCGRTDDDVKDLAANLAAEAAPRVLLSHAPPRQRGGSATDVALGGIHIGDPAIAAAVASAGPVAAVHAGIDEAGGRVTAGGKPLKRNAWAPHVFAAAGALEAAPAELPGGKMRYGAVLLLEIDGQKARARPIFVDAAPP